MQLLTAPPFIADQRLFHLTAPPELRNEWLRPENFQRRRMRNPQGQLSWPAEEQVSPPYGWDEVSHREPFLTRRDLQLLCVTDNAGMGKTMALQQVAYLRSLAGELVIRTNFGRLPRSVHEYMGEQSWLFWHLLPQMRQQNLQDQRRLAILSAHLNRALQRGQFTIAVDALDQSNRNKHPEDSFVALLQFLKLYPRAKCVLAGRPFALGYYWRLAEEQEFGWGWEFAQLESFTQTQQDRFLGPVRAPLVRHLGAEVLHVPRTLETLLKVPVPELQSLRSTADIYWKCVEALLESAKEQSAVPIPHPEARKLLALVAFEMHQRDLFDCVEGGHQAIAGSSEIEKFAESVWETRPELHATYKTQYELVGKWGEMCALNVAIDPGVLAISHENNPHSPELNYLAWRNRTLQDYFAAHWCARYGSTADVRWLAQHQHLWGRWHEHAAEPQRYEFWKHLAEMPAPARFDRTWVQMVSPLYLRNVENPLLVRSSEMLYRSWTTLLQIGGWLPGKSWTEEELQRVTTQVQREVFAQVKSGTLRYQPAGPLPPEGKAAARHVVQQFLAEFPAILFQGHRPQRLPEQEWFTGTRLPQEIVREFYGDGTAKSRGDFIVIPAGRFHMGDAQSPYSDEPASIQELSTALELCRYQWTNELQALYSPGHPMRFGDYRTYSPEPRCPAIYLNWYDSWCLALWAHCRLPSEFEWERACRGDRPVELPPEQWSCGSEEQLAAVAWYSGNSETKRRTHPVGLLGTNTFELRDMHGNVWEWTGSRYNVDTPSRVLRGGAFSFNAGVCRSACRVSWPPAYSDGSTGVRLSRAVFP